ncbi:hypothetical protein MKEN_01209300 [Mycena kentingensis (nom. inval.)]|nr:hypothetical protein MKEN_01209300 [Mycena kentingensis (nom. inval.)]
MSRLLSKLKQALPGSPRASPRRRSDFGESDDQNPPMKRLRTTQGNAAEDDDHMYEYDASTYDPSPRASRASSSRADVVPPYSDNYGHPSSSPYRDETSNSSSRPAPTRRSGNQQTSRVAGFLAPPVTNPRPSAPPASRVIASDGLGSTTHRRPAVGASQLSSIVSALDTLKQRVTDLERSNAAHQESIDERVKEYDALKLTVEALDERLGILEGAVSKLSEGRELGEKEQQAVDEIKIRDNALNAMLRAVYSNLMGIDDGDDTQLPEPYAINGKTVFWRRTENNAQVLNPDFTKSWTLNKPWHAKILEKVKSDGHRLHPACPQSSIDAYSDKRLMEAIRDRYKNLQSRYKQQQLPSEEQEEKKRKKTLTTRKTKKLGRRNEARNHHPELRKPMYDFMFDLANQSTDHTSIASGSASEREAKKVRYSAEHRGDEWNNTLDALDDTFADMQVAEGKKNLWKEYKRVPGVVLTSDMLPTLKGDRKYIAAFLNEGWVERLEEDKKAALAKMLYGMAEGKQRDEDEEDGYDADAEIVPVLKKVHFEKKAKGKSTAKPSSSKKKSL